ncbi:FlgO family outer membrane protein [Elusimicrobiota bacterium]
MRKKSLLTILITGFAIATLSIDSFAANFLERQLIILTQQLAKEYKSKTSETEPVSIIVLPFDSPSKDLKDRKIGTGVSELISTNIVKYESNIFKVIEREQLKTILAEQGLALSGAVSGKAAMNISSMAGAKLMLSGSVTATEKYYMIQARIIDTESGKILATTSLPLPIKQFEEETKENIITRKKSIGVYMSYRMISIEPILNKITVIRIDDGKSTEDRNMSIVEHDSTSQNIPCIGNRFYFTDNIMADISLGYVSGEFSISDSSTVDMDLDGGVTIFAFYAHWAKPVGPRIDLFAGSGINFCTDASDGISYTVTPVLRAGIEWRPTQRIGLTLFGSYLLTHDIISQALGDGSGAVVEEFKWGDYSIEPVIVFYF